MANNYLNLLGIAYAARKCSLGEEVIVKDIQANRAKLILLANDIGPSTKKKLIDKCKTYDIPFVTVDSRDVLSQSMGEKQRVAVAILDNGFAHKFQSLLKV